MWGPRSCFRKRGRECGEVGAALLGQKRTGLGWSCLQEERRHRAEDSWRFTVPGLSLSITNGGSRGKGINAFSAPTGLPLRACREQQRVSRVNLKLWGQASLGQGAGVTAVGVASPEAKERRSHAVHLLSTVSCVTLPDAVCSPEGGQPLDSAILITDTVR